MKLRIPHSAFRIRSAGLALAMLAIGVATLRPAGDSLPNGWSFQLASGDEALAEAIQNLLLFVPFGVALALFKPGLRWRTLLLAGVALSFTVEFLQQWIPGRDPSLGDIVTNALSTVLGGALVWTAPRWLHPPEQRAPWFGLGAAAVAATAWLGTGWLLQPMLPDANALEIRAPDLGSHMDLYSGQVLSVTGRLGATVPLRIVATAGAPSGRLAPLLAVDDGPWPAGTIVAADRTDLVLRNRSRSMFLGLDRPDLRARGALAGALPGDTITITAWTDANGPALCVAVDEKKWCGLGYTMGDGWRLLFYPGHFTPFALSLLNACWIAGGCLGLGWWGRRHRATGAALLLAALALALGPGLVGLNPTPWNEWLGGVMGLTVGWLAWRGRNTLSFWRAPPSH